jgi:hypothetical protein
MAGTRNLSVSLSTAFSDEGLQKAKKQLEGLGGRIEKLGSKALKLGASFAVFQGGRALVDFASGAIEQSRDLTRNMNGLQSVFGELTPQMVAFTESSHKMGLSQSEAAKSVTFIGSVLKQSGFAIGETAALTQRLITLGTDLSITYGYDVQEALLGMTALFRGEYDPIEKFGVAMKQSEIDAVKAARGLSGLTGSAERLADQQIRVELLFQRSADAQGMYAKSSDTLFVAQQNLEAVFKNMQATAGQALTPAFTDLTLAMTPLVEELTPMLAQLMRQLIPVVTALTENTDGVKKAINEFANGILFVVKVAARLAAIIIDNIGLIKQLGIVLVSLAIGYKVFAGLIAVARLFAVAVGASVAAIRLLKIALVSIGIGAIAVGVGFLAEKFLFANDKADDFASSLPNLNLQLGDTEQAAAKAAYALDLFKKGASINAIEANSAKEFAYTPPDFTGLDSGSGGGVGEQARDYVAEFYAGLKDEVKKQEATLKLESLGATSGLISSILGSGEEWQKVFDDVIKKGAKSVAAAQLLFNSTADGLAEITKRVEDANEKLKEAYEADLKIYEDAVKAFEAFEAAANDAGDAMNGFLSKMGVLPTFETAMGKFESEVVGNLENIEQQLKSAFDNGYLLNESYRNLQSYARSEFSELQKIAKQRDDLLNRRNLADALLKDVKNATLAAGNITNLLKNTQTETQKIDMAQVIQKTVQAGKNLKDFRVTIISDFVEPIEEAASKSQLLVSGFQAVVDRTRLFVDNLKALRQLGLDPLLFNQLVEAGVEAGGETAQALIDGGADTVNEVNSLFGELDALGQELGEQTAQVMYGEGQEFVNGIIAGLDSMLEDLEATAVLLADTFVAAFSRVLEEGIARAIAAAQAAMPSAPAEPVYRQVEEEIAKATEELEKVAEVVEKVAEKVKKATGGDTGGGAGGDTGDTKDTKVVAQSIKDFAALQSLSKNQMSALTADKKAAGTMFKTETVPFFGVRSGQSTTTINLAVSGISAKDGARAGQVIVKELNKYANASGTYNLPSGAR